jgi:hypothetical protein
MPAGIAIRALPADVGGVAVDVGVVSAEVDGAQGHCSFRLRPVPAPVPTLQSSFRFAGSNADPVDR